MTRNTSLENRIWAKNGVRVDPDTDNAAGADLLTVEGGNIDSQGPFSTHFNFQQHRMNALLNEVEQDGILEWSDKTNYSIGAFCKVGVGIYQSAIANNKNNAPASSPASWVLIPFAALLCRGIVKSRAVTDPPASPAAGDAYVIPASATGAWAGKVNQITVWHAGQWIFSNPVGYPLYVQTESIHVYWNGSDYQGLAGTGDVTGQPSSNDGEVVVFSGASGKSIKGTPLRVDSAGNLSGHGAVVKTISDATYRLLESDCGKILHFTNAAGCEVTCPGPLELPYASNIQCVLVQKGAAQVTVVGSTESDDEATVHSSGDLFSTAQLDAHLSLYRYSDTDYELAGERA